MEPPDEPSAESTFETLNARRQARGQFPGWPIRAEILGLDRSLGVFNGNAEELEDFLREASQLPEALEIWGPRNRAAGKEYLDEIGRLLHNYLAAAMSLKDHSTVIQRKLLPESPSDDLAAEYVSRKDATFKDSPLSQFVQTLRSYSLHRRLPIMRSKLHIDRARRFDAMVMIPTKELRNSGKWTGLARQFLDESGEEILLRDVVADYNAAVRAFHVWFRRALISRHRNEIRALEAEERELARLWKEFEGEA